MRLRNYLNCDSVFQMKYCYSRVSHPRTEFHTDTPRPKQHIVDGLRRAYLFTRTYTIYIYACYVFGYIIQRETIINSTSLKY